MRAGWSWLRWPVHGVLNNSSNYLGLHGLVQQLQDQSPEPRCGLGGSDRAVNRIELNRIESNRIVFFFVESPIITSEAVKMLQLCFRSWLC